MQTHFPSVRRSRPFCLILGAFVFSAAAARSDGGPPNAAADRTSDTEHVWLHVKGKQIVTSPACADGERPFIAAGIGYARNVCIAARDEEVAAFCQAQHLNTIRLAFYTRFFNNHADRPIDLQDHLRTFVDPVIQAAKRHGLYVILDDHAYFSQKIDEAKARQSQAGGAWSEKGVNEWARRWGEVAARYKDEPYVMGYELCNEPHDIAPETVRDWYGRGLAEVRKTDTRHIVFVGTCNWSHARALEKTWGCCADTFDAPYRNVVFAFHDYPNDDVPWKVQRAITAFRDTHGVPVLCTEFGATWWDHDETVCREFQAGLLAVCATEKVGWMVWALTALTNNPRHPHPPTKAESQGQAKPAKKSDFDSCAYSDLWSPVARIMASPFPQPAKE